MAGPKKEWRTLMDVSGSASEVQCYKEQYCIGTWNVRSMNQGKLDMVKCETAKLNVNIWEISEHFSFHEHSILGQEFRWPLYLPLWARIPKKKQSSPHNQQKSLKCSIWVLSQKWQNDLSSFPRQAIQHQSNSSLCTKHLWWRSWSWPVLWRLTRLSRTNTTKNTLEITELKWTRMGDFHQRGLECKSRKSVDTWNNRQVWPCSTKLSKAKANSVVKRMHWS